MIATFRTLNIDIHIHGIATFLLKIEGLTPLLTIHLLYSGQQVDNTEGTTTILYFLKFPRLILLRSDGRASPWSVGLSPPLRLLRSPERLQMSPFLKSLCLLLSRPISHPTLFPLSSSSHISPLHLGHRISPPRLWTPSQVDLLGVLSMAALIFCPIYSLP